MGDLRWHVPTLDGIASASDVRGTSSAKEHMDARSHWEAVYACRQPTEVSWYQAVPARSLELLTQCGLTARNAVIDVGGGDSTLVDALVERGVASVSVLDISGTALARARQRLGERAATVTWLEADVTRADLPGSAYDIWHDRAVFHFLMNASDRERYVANAARALRPGGIALLATFAPDGPTRCSGLDVVRYAPEDLLGEFGADLFELVDSCTDTHHTPAGTEQLFTYTVLQRRPG